MFLIGIDPGLGGAIATWQDGPIGAVGVVAMPIVKGEKRDQYDLQMIRERLLGASHVFVEKLQPMPGKFGGAIANYQRGRGLGVIEGICAGIQVPCTAIPPRVWQREILSGIPGDDTKQRSILAAKQLFPTLDLRRTPQCTKDHDGIADALCLLEYGRRLVR